MKLGIIGKPQCGKTTVFNAVSGQQAAVGDYSQAMHRAIIRVPDPRVDQLAEIFQPERRVYPEIEFLDAPGFSGKGKEAESFEVTREIREMDALILVIDAFSSEANPPLYIRNIFDEMLLTDQVLVENNIENKARKAKLTGDKTTAHEIDLLKRLLVTLEAEQPLIDMALTEDESKLLRGYQFITLKPVLIALNIAESDLPRSEEIRREFQHLVEPGKRDVVTLCGKIQMELALLEPDEQQAFMAEMGVTGLATDKLIRRAYALLGLISFLTVGKDECRAWMIRKGTTAVRAAGAVHSDIERGFIRAEVTHFEDILKYKTLAAVKAAGKTRLEGKDYVVQDGDEILFRFNV